MDLYPSILKALTWLDKQGAHKLHSYKGCNFQQKVYLLVEFVKNPTGQMVRPQLPFCIPSKKDSLRIQKIRSKTFFCWKLHIHSRKKLGKLYFIISSWYFFICHHLKNSCRFKFFLQHKVFTTSWNIFISCRNFFPTLLYFLLLRLKVKDYHENITF